MKKIEWTKMSKNLYEGRISMRKIAFIYRPDSIKKFSVISDIIDYAKFVDVENAKQYVQDELYRFYKQIS